MIEYQGVQHEKAVDYFGGEEQFQKQKRYDQKKRDWCREKGVRMIEIWYGDYERVEEILERELG